MEAKTSKYKVVYIHGRPSGHPIHDRFARELEADFVPVDFYLPWHANANPNKFKKYLSWLFCALFFPRAKQYHIYFTESVREPILIRKILGLFSKRQKLIPLMDNETLFFYHNNKYSKLVRWMVKTYLKKSDVILCVGNFQAELATKIIGIESSNKIKTINNWVFPEKQKVLEQIKPILNSNKILFIGDVSAEFRAWYKGVDLMIKAFDLASKVNPDIILEMVGINDDKHLEPFLSVLSPETRKKIIIKERQVIYPFLETASLYLHCARGEAWGISIMEALSAGVPVICSDLTGAKEIVEKISKKQVVSTNETEISEKILWYFNLSNQEKFEISEKGRSVMKDYSEEKSLQKFHSTYNEILTELYA